MTAEACKLIQMQAVEYFLDLLEADETTDLKAHVKACPGCANAVRGIRGDFEVLARWGDVTPGRKSIVKLLRAYGGGGGDLTVVLPGEAEEEAIAADVIADAEAAAPAAPGLLLGPTMTDEARARILGEFGLDSSGHRAPTRRRKQQKASVDLADLTTRAESAAARVSGRLSRSAAENEWSALTGTTRIAGDTRGPDKPVNPDLAAKASSAWEKIKARRKKSEAEQHAEAQARERQDAKWEALAGQTMLAGSEADDLREELLIDENEQEAAALMGTTILSAQTTQSTLMPRYRSGVLQQIKSEGEVKRKLKRAAAIGFTRMVAWSGVVAGHAAVVLMTALIVWSVVQPPPMPTVTIGEPKEPEPDIPPDKKEELLAELQLTDPTDTTEQPDDVDEQTDPRKAQEIAVATDPDKARSEPSEPFREPREGRGGRGARGGGPLQQVEWALDWLTAHQSPSGAWEWRNYRAMCERHGGPACGGDEITVDGREERHFSPGLTALALLSFTASGYHHVPPRDEAAADYKARHAKRRPTVERGLAWLRAQQEADGAIGRKIKGNDDPDFDAGGFHQDPEGYMYNHAIGTLALCDAYATSKDEALREPAQRAVDFLCRAQDAKRGGWDYYPCGHLPKEAQRVPVRHRHRGDLSITGWAAVALKVAEMATLKVPPECKKAALEFVKRLDGNAVANPEPRYAEGYWTGWNLPDVERALLEQGVPPPQRSVLLRARDRLKDATDVPEGRRGVAMTAVSALAKLSLGVPLGDRDLQAQVAHLLKNAPSEYALTTPRKGFTNHDHSYYYWYYGTLVLWNLEDERWLRWWDDALKPVILKLQVAEGPARGSWPACDPVWGGYAGRLYSTALCTLTLEVFYRYAPLAQQERGNQLLGASFAELAREVEQSVAWCEQPRTPPRDGWQERAEEACRRLVDAAAERGLAPGEREAREARTLALIERVALLPMPPPAGDAGPAAEWREAVVRARDHLRLTAIRRLAKLPSSGSVELARKVLRQCAKDEPMLAVAAVSAIGSKPLVWVVRDVDAAEVARLSDPSITDQALREAAGVTYRRIQEAREQRAALLARKRAKGAAAEAAAGPPGGGD